MKSSLSQRMFCLFPHPWLVRAAELCTHVHSLMPSALASAELGGHPLQVHLSPVPEHQWAHLQQECVTEGLVSCGLNPEGSVHESQCSEVSSWC